MSPTRRRRPTPTPDQIWRILRITARERRAAERRAAALEERYRRADEERKNADEERRQADEKRRQADEARRQAQEERDRALQATLNRIAGDGDNRFGELMEALIEGNVVPLFRKAGLDVERAFPRVRSRTLDDWREYDVVAVGIRDAVVVEVKTTLRSRDVAQFTERIRDFREWRPDHARPRVWGALAYLSANAAAVRAAEAAGFYVIRVVSTTASLVNSEGFEARVF